MSVLTEEQFEDISHIVSDLNAEILYTYSGRCMHGEKCVAITFEDRTQFSLGATLGLELCNMGHDDLCIEMIESCKTDTFGNGQVVYFPGIQYNPESVSTDESA